MNGTVFVDVMMSTKKYALTVEKSFIVAWRDVVIARISAA
jgi:hypothetical protein